MTQFIMLFASTLFLSSLLINGWYNITRGQWQIKPNGEKEWNGKIFSFWSKLLQTHESTFENYFGNEFLKQFHQIEDFFKNPHAEILDFGPNAVLIRKMDTVKFSRLFAYALSKGIFINVEEPNDDKDKNKMLLTIFKEVKHYKIPNILRAPLGECLACMSSLYGTLCWIFWYKIVLEHNHFFAGMLTVSKFGLWIIFCITLAYLNELIFSVNHKLQQS